MIPARFVETLLVVKGEPWSLMAQDEVRKVRGNFSTLFPVKLMRGNGRQPFDEFLRNEF